MTTRCPSVAPAKILDHGADLAGGIEHHGGAGPGQHGGHADGGGLEAAGAGEDQGMGGAGAAGIDQQRRGAALAPAGFVRRVAGAAADPVLVDAVSLADDDAAKGFVRSGEQAARLAHGEPIGVAEIIGPATDQARAASAAEPLKSEAPTEQRGETADRDSL